jgi:Kef-type K+ transport system membrane component KefB
MFKGDVIWRGFVYAILMAIGKLCCGFWLVRFRMPAPNPQAAAEKKKQKHKITLPRPKSLYPAAILGCAMVARGEIGFLIAALAATNGIFASHDPTTSEGAEGNLTSELYLIVTWAILLCTIAGPLVLGLLAKRVKRLQEERVRDGGHGAKEDPLGIWGIK